MCAGYPAGVNATIAAMERTATRRARSGPGPAVMIAGLQVAAFVPYVVRGTGFVLDDWFTLRNARFGGALHAAGDAQSVARPGAAVVDALAFGVVGRHPLVLLLGALVIAVLTGLGLLNLLRRFLPLPLAVGACVVWIVAPNHTSLEVWASALNIGVALLLSVGAGLLLSTDPLPARRLLLAGVLAAAATLSYEAVVPALCAGFVVLPWLRSGRIDRRAVGAGAISIGAAVAWMLLHWHPDKHLSSGVVHLGYLWSGLFGWGVAPDGLASSILTLAALAGMAVAVSRLCLPSFRPALGEGEYLVVAGLALAVLGLLPFVRYVYEPLGAGDRALIVSAVGGAMVWAGLAEMAWRSRHVLAASLATVVVLSMAAGRWQAAVAWDRAAEDASGVLQALRRYYPAPNETLVIGPSLTVRRNVAGLLDTSNVEAAVQVIYDDPTLRAEARADTVSSTAATGLRLDTRTRRPPP